MTSPEPITDYIYSKASRARIPLSGTFELSPLCNFNCKMCYVKKTEAEVAASGRKPLDLDFWLDLARRASNGGMLFLLLTGGEPLLWPDFWTLYGELTKMGIFVSVNTNASLIGEEEIARFAANPPRRVNVTLYGASDGAYERLCGRKGMFSRVDGAIKGLRSAGVTVKINGSFTPENVCDMPAITAYAAENNIPLQTAFYMFPPVRRDEASTGQNSCRFTPEEAAAHRLEFFRLQNGEEKYRAYLESIRSGSIPPPGLDESCIDPLDGHIRCRAGSASFWVTWEGMLTPCGLMPKPAVDLCATEFSKAWAELSAKSAALALSGTCTACPNQRICHACAAMAYAETGSFTGIPAYLCQMAEEMRRIAAKRQ